MKGVGRCAPVSNRPALSRPFDLSPPKMALRSSAVVRVPAVWPYPASTAGDDGESRFGVSR